MAVARDITGQTFNHLTAIRFHRAVRSTPKSFQRRFWIFRCSCGNEKSISQHDVTRGRIKGCGCRMNQNRVDQRMPALSNKFLQCKGDAKNRGLAWELSWEQFVDLSLRPCQNCGTPPSQVHKRVARGHIYECKYTGIDRIDNALGYIIGNVRPFCVTCNFAKHAMAEDDFQKWVQRLVAYRTGQKEGI